MPGQGRGEVEVLATLAQVLVVDQHRERLEALAQQHRRAEVGKGLHEHHQGRRQDRGHGQCQHNVEQAAHTGAAILAEASISVLSMFLNAPFM